MRFVDERMQLAFIVNLALDACALSALSLSAPVNRARTTRLQRFGVVPRQRGRTAKRWVTKGAIMRSLQAVAASALVLLVVGCTSTGGAHLASAAPAARPMSKMASVPHSARAMRCRAGALILRPGAYVSPMTGEHAVMYALINHGSAACTLDGYPQVVLYGAGGAALPFRYLKGGGTYATHKKPATVVLAPGAAAYVLVAKYRCDLGTVRTAATIQLTLPAAGGVTFVGRESVGGSGSLDLSYCRGGPDDPGQTVAVSPIEPTQQATRAF
jgi:Protein of unknown function (DUF4232)